MSKRYTVQQVALLSGVSVRTLHHYDRIGLLVPAAVGENGYRYYGHAELLRLQQILFYREFGMALKEIAPLLTDAGEQRVAVLRQHRARLAEEAQRCRQLLETIDRTIASLTGGHEMQHEDLYKGLSPERQARYQKAAAERHGTAAVDQSAQAWSSLDQPAQAQRMQELAQIEGELAHAQASGLPADSPQLDAVLARHRAWVAAMWSRPCPPDAYAGLADTYRATPEFRARFNTLSPGLSDYLPDAMQAYAVRLGALPR